MVERSYVVRLYRQFLIFFFFSGQQAYSSTVTQFTKLCMVGLCRELWWQGRIEPPKAARGHATSNSANIDSIVLNVTKNRDPRAACKTAHT